ncbi:MAG: acetyl-CoA carboxylase biotin carboxyl carrier protein [Oscillospiraceae bacterium]|nr:acetyl-CoA carboxylase biotin carboxyl carrier protein [Oscillospiraceae bacterium]
MDLQAIEKLIAMIDNSSVKEFSYKDESVEITISTLDNPPIVAPMAPAAPAVMAAPYPAAGTSAPAAPEAAPAEDEPEFITSPIVATFYSAAGPEIPAYVRVGDRVKAGDTVCILEAMKLMNEITADFDCEIEAILVSNEQRVEYGQPLFRVKKL